MLLFRLMLWGRRKGKYVGSTIHDSREKEIYPFSDSVSREPRERSHGMCFGISRDDEQREKS